MMQRRKAEGALAQFVGNMWWSENRAPRHSRERALPTGSMMLVLNLGDEPIRIFRDEQDRTGQSFSHSVIWGPQTRYVVRDSKRRGAVVGVQFRPGMAGSILGIAASELTDQFASLPEIWGQQKADMLREYVAHATTPGEQIAAAERMLTGMRRPLLIRPEIAYALQQLARVEAPPVEMVRREAGHSARRFIELFTESTGMTPKLFSRVRRFQHVLEQACRRNEKPDWARIAAEGGFSDQAHLTHEFGTFAGITPGVYKPIELSMQNHVAIPE